MGSSFLVITVIAGIVAFAFNGSGVLPPNIINANDSRISSSEVPGESTEDSSASVGESLFPGASDSEEPEVTPVSFNRPDELRAVYLIPGEDFILNDTTSAEQVQKEIDAALTKTAELHMNSVIVDLRYNDTVIYKSSIFRSKVGDFDAFDYLTKQAKEKGLFVYAIYEALSVPSGDKIVTTDNINGDTLDTVANGIKEIVEGYSVDGILIENYFNETKEGTYGLYAENGISIGFDNYMYQNDEAVIKTISDTVRAVNRNVQVGICTTSVWANSEVEENGSKTNAEYQMLYDGHADVKKYIEKGYVDFVSVKASGAITDSAVPFDTVVSWWADLTQQNNIPMYIVHSATKACTDSAGWSSPDQLTRQVIEARKISGYKGSAFNSLKALAADPKGSTNLLMNYYADKVKVDHIMKDLAITQPAKKAITTNEPTITFKGASDPNFPITLNGEALTQDDNGYITFDADLKPGENTFTFEHKEKAITYTIDRDVQVLKEVSPAGSISPLGNSAVTVTVVAYKGAKVTASLAGQSITLKEDTSPDDSDDQDSNYCRFIGTLTMPDAKSSVQNLGTISVKATAEGVTESKSGASVKVAEAISYDTSGGNGDQIQVIATQAETFPTDTIDDYSDPDYHPLPKGTLDKAVSDAINFSDGKTSFTYYILASGVRVYKQDISFIDDQDLSSNKISKMTVDNDGRYTTVSLDMSWKAPYTVNLSSTSMKINFKDTSSTPGNLSSLSKNPLFSSATWSGSSLTLKIKSGGFMGYQASYSGNTLKLKFNNPAPIQEASNSYGYTLNGARIVLDPGHNDADPGALGFYPDVNEREINRWIASETEDILEDLGATVQVNPSPSSSTLEGRMSKSISFAPHLLICIHCNSAGSSATGTESYYFNDFSTALASSAAKNVSSQLGITNRGAKFGYYYMTRNFAFPATLTEYGFVSNRSEYSLMISDEGQEAMARGTVKAIIDFFKSRYGSSSKGTESTGSVSKVAVTGVSLNKTSATLEAGKTLQLTAAVRPENATNQDVTWSSNNEDVATVDEDGLVRAIKAGTAKITVTTEEAGKNAVATITVKSAAGSAVTSVELDMADVVLLVNETLSLDATVLPDTAANKEVTWSSSASSVATVDADGKVTAKAVGTATITVTTKDGGKKATCRVKVDPIVAVNGVSISVSELNLEVGASESLSATVSPENAANKKVIWSSSNTTIATVDSNGKVTAKKAGTVTITAKTEDGEYIATCTVNVGTVATP